MRARSTDTLVQGEVPLSATTIASSWPIAPSVGSTMIGLRPRAALEGAVLGRIGASWRRPGGVLGRGDRLAALSTLKHASPALHATLMRVTRCSVRSARHDPICASASEVQEQSLTPRYRYQNGCVETSMGDLGHRVDNFISARDCKRSFGVEMGAAYTFSRLLGGHAELSGAAAGRGVADQDLNLR